jgi:transcriptional regulator with XRE-family HTH domain
MSFGTQIRALRQMVGKSQAEVASEIKAIFPETRISQTALSALEKQEKFPRQEVLEVLARYYGVSVGYFLNEQNAYDGERRALAYLRSLTVPDRGYRTEENDENEQPEPLREYNRDDEYLDY